MTKKSILFLFFICVIMICAVVFLENKDNEKKTIKIEVEDLRKISIEQFKDKQSKIHFVKKGQSWIINEQTDINYSVAVDEESILNLLNQLIQVDFETIQTERSGKELLLVEFETQTKKSYLKIEDIKNFEEKYFSNLNGKTVLLSSEIVQFFNQDFIYFQDKHPLDLKISELEFIKMNSNAVLEKDKLQFLDQVNKMTIQKYINSSDINRSSESRSIQISLKNKVVIINLFFNEKLQAEVFLNEQQKYFVEFDITYWAYFANYHIKDKL